MSVENPSYLWFLLGLGLVIPLFIGEYLSTRKILQRLGGEWEKEAVQYLVFVKWLASTVFFSLFYVSAVFAMSGINWGEKPVEQDRKDSDLVYALDVSLSMLANDKDKSRLDRSREFILGSLQDFPESRVSLVHFKGAAGVLVPMTEDFSALENSLRYAGPDSLSSPGTNLELALKTSLEAFPKGSNRHKIILLFTDGEELSGNAYDLALQIRRQGILLVCLGLGSDSATGITLGDKTALLDKNGNRVLSRLNRENLKTIADLAGGLYLEASEPGAYRRMVDEVTSYRQRQDREGFRLEPIDRSNIFTFFALFFLSVYVGIRAFRWRKVW